MRKLGIEKMVGINGGYIPPQVDWCAVYMYGYFVVAENPFEQSIFLDWFFGQGCHLAT